MIRYRIYENREGLLKRPQERSYGSECDKFDDFESLEDAAEAIQAEDFPPTYIVTPVISKDWSIE